MMGSVSIRENFNIPTHARKPEVTPETILYMDFNDNLIDYTERHKNIHVANNGNVYFVFDEELDRYCVKIIDDGIVINGRADRDFRWLAESFSIEFLYKVKASEINTTNTKSLLTLLSSTESAFSTYPLISLTFILHYTNDIIHHNSPAYGGHISGITGITGILTDEWVRVKVCRNSHSTRVFINNELVEYVSPHYSYNWDHNLVRAIDGDKIVLGKPENDSYGHSLGQALTGYFAELKVTRPKKLLWLRFDGDNMGISATTSIFNSHLYIDDAKRHQFIEEGTVSCTLNAAHQTQGGLDARVGNIKSTNHSPDFTFSYDFNIACQLRKINAGDGTFWIIYDENDIEVLALKYIGGDIQVTGYSGTVLGSYAYSFPNNHIHIEVYRINGLIKLILETTTLVYYVEVISVPYSDVIDGRYIRIGGEGSGSGSYIDNFVIERG